MICLKLSNFIHTIKIFFIKLICPLQKTENCSKLINTIPSARLRFSMLPGIFGYRQANDLLAFKNMRVLFLTADYKTC